MSSVLGLDHVQVAMPPGGEERARAFYAGVLGMVEVPKPPVLAVYGGLWFVAGAAEVHLGVEDGFRAAKKAHPAFRVCGLRAAGRLCGRGARDRVCRAAGGPGARLRLRPVRQPAGAGRDPVNGDFRFDRIRKDRRKPRPQTVSS
jgi:catechol 2,3-dioxygenase-like lactoylglutathione lyase family enzyme